MENLFQTTGLKCENVYVVTADGGSENNGSDRVNGLGEKGLIARLFPHAIWVWCNAHVAQICYQKSFKVVPLGWKKGLREVVAFTRRGDNHIKILAHASRLAGEDNAEFQDSVVHAMVADEIEWKEEIRSKKGRSDHKFDHRIIKGASEIRFASCIPGNNMVIALGELYAPSIRLEWGGNDASKITCNGAHKAYGVLTDNQWAFWSRVLEVTFTLVVQVMFKDIVCNSGYNLPELAIGGMWQRWVAALEGATAAATVVEATGSATGWATVVAWAT